MGLRLAAESERLSVGATLEAKREEHGWDVTDIAAALRIRADYLTALETGNLAALPGTAYATGFLRAYAEFLGLDSADIVRRFKAEKTGLRVKPELTFPMPLTERGVPGSGIVMIAVICVGLGYGTWFYLASGTNTAVPTVQPVPARLLAPPTLDPPTISPGSAAAAEPPAAQQVASAPAAPPPTATQDAAPDQHVFGNPISGAIVVKATADSWVEVLDNEHPIWSRLLKAGDVYNPPKAGLVMRVGNAGGVEITLNGKTLPALGQTGEVVRVTLDPATLGG